MSPRFKQVVKLLQKLPGVGPRQAARFVLALLQKDEKELQDLGYAISNLKRDVRFCNQCFNTAEDKLCSICLDPKRESKNLLVVERVTDLESIEKTGIYKGLYHILEGAINPLDGLTPEKLRFKELSKRVNDILEKKRKIELIIATNPNTSGETTALYIKDLFKNKKGMLITRLGRGLSSGSNLEYADETTLRNALEYRK